MSIKKQGLTFLGLVQDHFAEATMGGKLFILHYLVFRRKPQSLVFTRKGFGAIYLYYTLFTI